MLYWKLGKYSTMRHYPHCIKRVYTHIWIIVFMYGAEPMKPIWMISVYYRTRSFESKKVFPREQTLTIYTASRVFCLLIACIIIILGYSCTNTPTICFLECLIISFTKLKIHTHIVLVNPQQKICMWNFEILREDKDPAYIAVQSSGISYWTTSTLIVILVHLKDNLKHYS